MEDSPPSLEAKIAVLSPAIASKIAAGEVVDRPSSVLRELLDNAIDAAASKIVVSLEDGGIKRIRVTDNGSGMTNQDLRLCHLAHATSKIRVAEDLQHISSLGFRGEALNSIAACAKISINSRPLMQQHGWCLQLEGSNKPQLERISCAIGSTVDVSDLFYYIPARRHFLKRPSSELQHCRQILLEKAISFPAIEFLFNVDAKPLLYLPNEAILQRLIRIYPELYDANLQIMATEAEHIKLSIVAASPQLQRRNRSMIQIYVNQRRIDDAKLLQAVRLAYDGYMPGGVFPVCFVFFTINPERLDFNVHPAKREARFLDLSTMQTLLRRLLRRFCGSELSFKKQAILPAELLGKHLPVVNQNTTTTEDRDKADSLSTNSLLNKNYYHSNVESANLLKQADSSINHAIHAKPNIKANSSNSSNLESDIEREHEDKQDFRYIGQLMKLFLLFEYQQTLYIVDQHAAHERLLYQEMVEEGLPSQELLLPQALAVEPQQQQSLKQRAALLQHLGIQLAYDEQQGWQVIGLPPQLEQLSPELEMLILNGASTNEDLQRQLFAKISCCKAIRGGDILDQLAAVSLIKDILLKGLLHCPHGRPIATSFSRKQLDSLLGRTV